MLIKMVFGPPDLFQSLFLPEARDTIWPFFSSPDTEHFFIAEYLPVRDKLHFQFRHTVDTSQIAAIRNKKS
jgi:hypothetical protein